MTTNQEGRQAAIRDTTSSVYGVAADWHALFDDAGISAGTFNERLLAWINAELSASYSNLVSAMQAYAEDAGYDGWEDMATLVLAMNGAETLLDGETQGLAFDFTDQSALIIDTGTPANDYDSTGIVSSGSLVGPSGKLTYTSPSNKLTMQSDGFIKYQAHNLYLNSASPANQSITVVSGASYAVTITGSVSVTASGASTGTWTAGTNTFTAATTTLTLGSTSGSGTVHVYRTPAVTDYVATAGSAVYSIPYEYDTSGACKGLLVEEQRTNLQTYSNTLSNAAWAKVGAVAQNAIGPTGNTDAWTLTDTVAAAAFRASQNPTMTAASYTHSVYAKAGTNSWLRILADSTASGSQSAWFNVSTGVKGTDAAGTGTITDVGNGWYKCSVTYTMTAATCRIYFQMCTDDNQASYTGDSTGTLLLWNCQSELGSFPTSPIITYGATATRAADNISIAASAFPYSATVGSIYEEFTPSQISSFTYLAELTDGTLGERVAFGTVASTGVLNAVVSDGGVAQVNASTSESVTANTTSKAAVAYELNNTAAVLDGGTVILDGSCTMPTCTSLIVGNRHTAAGATKTHIKAISYVPRRKSNAELQAETA